MGHEAVGVIEAVGDGVERFSPGDRVVSSCLLSCGSCERCLEGDYQVCQTMGAPMNLLFGAQSDLFLVSSADFSMAPVPASLDDRHAVLTADIMSTGFGALERAGAHTGSKVAIFAQGPVGLCATAAARYYGAEIIAVVERLPVRAEMARRFGATHVFTPEEAVDAIRALTGGQGVDIAVEALGSQATVDACFRSVRYGGTVSSVGVYGSQGTIAVPVDGSFYHRTFVTTLCPAGPVRLDELLRILDTGRVDLAPLFTHSMKLAEMERAYEMFRRREDGVLKIAIQ
jgi:alcohol dehydrogenase